MKHLSQTMLFIVMMFCCAAVKSAPPIKAQPIYVLDFKDSEKDTSFRASRLADRFRSLARIAVPANKKSWDIRFDMSETGQAFSLTVLKQRHELQISVPENLSVWGNDPNAHLWLMSICLLGQMGENLSTQNPKAFETLTRHWLVRGLACKAAREHPISPRPFSNPFYPAYVLTSRGIYPSVDSLIQTAPALPQITPLFHINAEYAELFMDFLSSVGFFKAGLGREVLQYALVTPDIPPIDVFHKLTVDLFPKKDVDKRFHAYLTRALITYFTPFSTEELEKAYNRISILSFEGKDGENHQCALRDFTENAGKMKTPNSVLDNVMASLKILNLQVPPQFRESLSNIRLCVARFRTEQTAEAKSAFENAEDMFYNELDLQVQAESRLSAIERQHTTPGLRLFHTLDALLYRGNFEYTMPKVNRLLDRLDDYRH